MLLISLIAGLDYLSSILHSPWDTYVLCGATEGRILPLTFLAMFVNKREICPYVISSIFVLLFLVCYVSVLGIQSKHTHVDTYLGGEDFDNSTRALSKPSPPKCVTAEHCHRAERSSGNP